MLQVSPSTIEGAQFWVDSRLTFHGQAIVWSTGPFDATGPDALLLPIDLPPAARLDPAQTDYVSVIVSRVRLEHAPDGHARRSTWATAPLLSAVFPTDGAPVLLDADQAAAVAPAGVYAPSERARWSQLGVDVHQPGLTLGPEVR